MSLGHNFLMSITMDSLKQPALIVGEIDNKIDHSTLPTSGEEYIKRVVIEAQQCADVVVANTERMRLNKPTIDISSNLAGCIKAPACLGPSLEWQQCQIAHFSEVKLYISQLKSEIQTQKRIWKRPHITFPDIEDSKGWIEFCLGGKNKGASHNPLLNVVFCLTQPTVEQVLEYILQHVEAEGKIDYEIGQWIYALLTILELPLNPDTCSCLRSLARCRKVQCHMLNYFKERLTSHFTSLELTNHILIQKNQSKLESYEVRSLNLFICLIARYFRQLDLADP